MTDAGALWAVKEQLWLEPVALARNYGFSGAELNKLAELVAGHQSELLKAWHLYHG